MGRELVLSTERIGRVLKTHGFASSGSSLGVVIWSRSVDGIRRDVRVPVKSRCDEDDVLSVVAQSGIAREHFCASFDPMAWIPRFEAYESWLRGFSAVRARQFHQAVAQDPDGSAVELRTQQLLIEAGLRVTPNCDASGGSDFVCSGPSGEFEVEASAIKVETLMDKMAIADVIAGPTSHGGPWTMIRAKLDDPQKQAQFQRATKPLLLVLGTEHLVGGCLSLDPLWVEWMYSEPESGHSIFFARDPISGAEITRLPGLSAVLLLAPDAVTSRGASAFATTGMLNPGAARQLSTPWLSRHKFCHYLGTRTQNGPVCEWFTGDPARRIDRDAMPR